MKSIQFTKQFYFLLVAVLLAFSQIGYSQIYISEINYNPCGAQGTDGNCEHLEIFNAYSTPIDISGWSMTGITFTFPANTTIMSGEYIILALNDANIGACGFNIPVGTQVFDFSGALGNSGETDVLIDACGGVVSSVSYDDADGADGDCDAQYFDSSGTFVSAGAPTAGSGTESVNTTPYVSPFELVISQPLGCIEANSDFNITVCLQCTGVDVAGFTGDISLDLNGTVQTMAATAGCAMFTVNSPSGNYTANASGNATTATPITYEVSPLCTVFISEIAADNGSGDGQGASEWVELYNPTGAAVDMSCYVLTDGDWAITMPPGTMIGAMSYFTIGVDALASCPNCDNADAGTGAGTLTHDDLAPNPANTVPVALGTEYDIDVAALNTAGYYTGSMVSSACPDGTGTGLPNFLITSTAGEQMALFDGTGGTTDPIYALNWIGGDFSGGNGNATAASPTGDACATNGVNYVFPTDTTDPFYDTDAPSITKEIACSSSFSFINGEWVVDDTPTPGQANDLSGYILMVDGVSYDLGLMLDINAPLQGDFGEKIFICNSGVISIGFDNNGNYQNLWVDETFGGVPVYANPGPFTSGGGRGSYIDVNVNGVTVPYAINNGAITTPLLNNGDVGYVELQIREQAYGSGNFNTSTCAPDNPLAPMSSDCRLKIRVPFEVVIPPVILSLTPSPCIGAEKYTFDGDLSGGTAPYEVIYDGTSIGSYMASPFTVGPLDADNALHNVEIRDANGCSVISTVMAPDPATCTNTCTDAVGTTALTYGYCSDNAPTTINLETTGAILNGPPPQIGWAVSTTPISSAAQVDATTFVGSGATFSATAPTATGVYYYTPFLSSTDPATIAIDTDCQDYGNPIIVSVAAPVSIVSATPVCSESGENYSLLVEVAGGLPTIDGTASYNITSTVSGVVSGLTATNTYTVGPFPVADTWDVSVDDGSCTAAMNNGAAPNCCPSGLLNAAFAENEFVCQTGTTDLEQYDDLELVNQYPDNAVLNWTSAQTTGSPVIDMTDLLAVTVTHSGTSCAAEVATFTLEIDCTTDAALNLIAGTITMTVYPTLDATDITVTETNCAITVAPNAACSGEINITYDADGVDPWDNLATPPNTTSGATAFYQVAYDDTNAPADCSFRDNYAYLAALQINASVICQSALGAGFPTMPTAANGALDLTEEEQFYIIIEGVTGGHTGVTDWNITTSNGGGAGASGVYAGTNIYLGPFNLSDGTVTITAMENTGLGGGETACTTTADLEPIACPANLPLCDCTADGPTNPGIINAPAQHSTTQYYNETIYQYVLVDTDNANTVLAVNGTGLFTDLPNGNYEVFAYNILDTDLAAFAADAGVTVGNTHAAPAITCFSACGSATYTINCFCCMADAGNIVRPTGGTLDATTGNQTICFGDDLGTFTINYDGATDETNPGATDYETILLLTDASGAIVQAATGDFDFSTLAAATYTVYALNYSTDNTPNTVAAYLAQLSAATADGIGSNISEIIADDNDTTSGGTGAGTFCLDLDNLDNDGLDAASDVVQVTILELPNLVEQFIGICSDANPYNLTNLETTITTATGTFSYAVGGTPVTDATMYTAASGDVVVVTFTDATTGCMNSNNITFTVIPAPNAGMDGTLTVCNADPSEFGFNLFDQLLGTAENTGTWAETGGTLSGVTPTGGATGTVNFQNIAAGTYEYTYTVVGTGLCADATATVTITVEDCFDLALIKELTTSGNITAGSTVTFDVSVINQGDVMAFDIVIEDYFNAAELTFVSAAISPNDASGATGSPATNGFEIDQIAVGATAIVQVTMTINTAFTGTQIINNAEITGAASVDNGPDAIDEDSTPNTEDGTTPDGNDNDTALTDGSDDYDPATVSICPGNCNSFPWNGQN